MTRKRRKPLNDSLAQQFVYGESETSPAPQPEPIPVQPEQPQGKELSLMMDKLQVQPKEATKMTA